MPICTKCKSIKSRQDFREREDAKNGLQYWCRECENRANRERYVPKPKKKRNPEEVKRNARDRMLRHRYGITLDEVNKIYEDQNGKCAICYIKRPKKGVTGLYVDHCHETGRVRGLLCPNCNAAIGKFKEDTKTLKSAIQYLDKHNN